MIVNLNLQGKIVIIVGGGKEAQKRINSLLKQDCRIIVISDSINAQISKLSKTKKITLIKQKIQDTEFLSEFKPNIVITTTNDNKINQKIINKAKRKNILVYS